jgi:hypothetical protein
MRAQAARSSALRVAQALQAQRDNRRVSGSPPRTNRGAVPSALTPAPHALVRDGELVGLTGIVGILGDGGGQLLHARRRFLERGGLFFGTLRQVLVARRNLVRGDGNPRN